MFKRLLISLALVASIGAGPCSAEPMAAKPFTARLQAVPDTIRVTAAPCVIAEPAVSCRVTTTGSAGAQPLNFGAAVTMAAGGQLAVSATFTCTPAAVIPISVSVASTALNRSGTASAPTSASATASVTCPDGPPGVPAPFTITITTGP